MPDMRTSMASPRFAPLIAGLPATVPFVGPEAQERMRGRPFRARIGANESVFGPSPRAIEAMCAAAAQSWMYGDPEMHDLKAAIARHHGIAPDNVAVDSGIDALLGLAVRMTVEPGQAVVTSAGAYPTFNYHVDGFGGRRVGVPYAGDREDPEALLAAARQEQAPLVYFANPDSPMGSWWGAEVPRRGQARRGPPGRRWLGMGAYGPEVYPVRVPQAGHPLRPWRRPFVPGHTIDPGVHFHFGLVNRCRAGGGPA